MNAPIVHCAVIEPRLTDRFKSKLELLPRVVYLGPDNLTETRPEAVVCVHGKHGAPELLERGQRLRRDAEIKDGVHHPWHRNRRPRANRHEKRIRRIAEPLPGLLLKGAQATPNVPLEPARIPCMLEIRPTHAGRNCKARGNRHSHPGHGDKALRLATNPLSSKIGCLVEEKGNLTILPSHRVSPLPRHSRGISLVFGICRV